MLVIPHPLEPETRPGFTTGIVSGITAHSVILPPPAFLSQVTLLPGFWNCSHGVYIKVPSHKY